MSVSRGNMIISASRRTDIPAWYADWFMHRVRAGYCTVPNPYNTRQISYVSLMPDEVEAVVFWTRNPRPLVTHLRELDDRGFAYYFLVTLVNYAREIEPSSLSLETAIAGFQELAARLGPERVIWRYDPVVLSNVTPASFHIDTFGTIAEKLAGYTRRSVFSFVEQYRKTENRLKQLERKHIYLAPAIDLAEADITQLVAGLSEISSKHGMILHSCAQSFNFSTCGVEPARCIDQKLIQELFRRRVSSRKDPAQRQECGCAASRDIGMYDSCLSGCSYCYATRSFDRARANHRGHDPASPSLLGWYDAASPAAKGAPVSKQQRLF